MGRQVAENALATMKRIHRRVAVGPEPLGPDAAAQIQLMLRYRELVDRGAALPHLSDVGFTCNSQTDEDGILLFLFAVLGTTSKSCVELCAADGRECNTANLILTHGWHGLLVDGSPTHIARARSYYRYSRRSRVFPPVIRQAWVTRDSVNTIITDAGFSGDVDLLSLDLDGVDYWIWDSVDAIRPRVVVVEFQDILGPQRAWTVPYADDFSAREYPTTAGMPNFAGASLAAFVSLAHRKQYRLVGVNRYGFNAFFVRNDVGPELIPEVSAASCFGSPKQAEGMRDRFPLVADLPWQTV